MDKYGELADRFHLEPGAAEAARQAAKAGSDAVEARALELVGLTLTESRQGNNTVFFVGRTP